MTATVTGDVKALSDACRIGSDFFSPFWTLVRTNSYRRSALIASPRDDC
jgi:hypothetical protein